MKTSPYISNQKIIIFIVFICSALITLLFVYHLRHQTKPITLTNDNGTIFSTARDIKSFKLLTDENKNFTEKDFQGHWTLLFFGFSHCSAICPATLDVLNKAYVKLHPIYPNLQLVLVSLDPERDTPSLLSNYVHSFHPDFIAATGQIQEIRKLQSQLGVFSLRDDASTQYQIQHTSSIMLINPQGKWAGLFKYGMNPEQFRQAFKESMEILG